MLTYICNNTKCNKVIEGEPNTILINNKDTYTLCDECLGKLRKSVNIPVTTVEEGQSKSEKKEQSKSEKTVKIKAEASVKDGTSKRLRRTNVKVVQAITEYGLDNLEKEICFQNKSITQICSSIGISRLTLQRYLDNNDLLKKWEDKKQADIAKLESYGLDRIGLELLNGKTISQFYETFKIDEDALSYYFKKLELKEKARRQIDKAVREKVELSSKNVKELKDIIKADKSEKTKDEKTDKHFNIEHTDFVEREKLRKMESTTLDMKTKCMQCAYRNKEISNCWYTMVTNKPSRASDNRCTHFVDIKEFIENDKF